MIDLKSVTEKYPDCLLSSDKLRSYLLDLYPSEKREIFVVCKLFDLDINSEIGPNNGVIDALTINRYCNRLEEEYGISAEYTKVAINTWQQLYFAGYYYGLGQRANLPLECKNLKEYAVFVQNMNLMAMKQILEDGSLNNKFATVVFTLFDDGKQFIKMMPIKEKEFFVYLHEYVNEMVKADNIRYIVITDDLGDRLVSIGFSKEDHIVISTEYKKENGEALFYENDYFTYMSADFRNIGVISVSEILYHIFINTESQICKKEDLLRYALDNANKLAMGITHYYNKAYVKAFQIFDKGLDDVCVLKPYYQYYLGRCFYEGNGVETNYEIAVNLFKKAAKYNLSLAEDRLADAYICGKGVKKDFYAGIGWMMRSAEHGYSDAMAELEIIINPITEDGHNNINPLYINDLNPALALETALKDDSVACFSVGSMYSELYKNQTFAIKWFDRSLDIMEKSEEKTLYYIVKSYKAVALYQLDLECLKENPKSHKFVAIGDYIEGEQSGKQIICNSEERIGNIFRIIFDVLRNADDDLSKGNAVALYNQIVNVAI